MKPHYTLFTDGSCGAGKEDVGAWAAFVCNDQYRKLLYGAAHPTTISRMELTPIIEGLRWIVYQSRNVKGIHVRVISDSEYTIKTLSSIYPEQKNEDLWAGVHAATGNLKVSYVYRERNTHTYMTLCDAVCSSLRKHVIAAMESMLVDARAPEAIVPVVALPIELDDQIMKGLQANANTSLR